jgi:DNA integrity scanning protein DisA with diadenylate cyclase activity
MLVGFKVDKSLHAETWYEVPSMDGALLTSKSSLLAVEKPVFCCGCGISVV